MHHIDFRITIAFASALLLATAACIPTGGGGGTDTGTTDFNQSDFGGDLPPVEDFAFDQDVGEGRYIFVMIVDRTPEEDASTDDTPGADIDGVELIKGGTSFYAEEIQEAEAGPVDVMGTAGDFTKLLRAPQEACNPDDPDFVALGGDGGLAIVTLGEDQEELQEGDELVIYECGGADNPGTVEDTYDVFIGVSTDPNDDRWVPCVEGASGQTTCTVPFLPDPNMDGPFEGSCTFSDGVCTNFNGSTTRSDASDRCADSNNPSGEPGTLSDTSCSTTNLDGVCASANPPPSDQESLWVYDSFDGDGQTYCEDDLGLVWTPGEDIVPPPMGGPFRYVRVTDAGSASPSGNGTDGADIDAIQLVHSGALFNATTVESFNAGTGDASAASDANEALGAPENGCDPANPDFVSLGLGGDLTVSFSQEQELSEGDVLTVFECGAMQTPGAPAEPYDIWLGTEAEPTEGTWVRCVSGVSGIATCLVPDPEEPPPSEPWQYVVIQDRDTSGAETADGTEGADIDAVQLQQGGLLYFAGTIEEYTPGAGDVTSADDPNEALGAPENSCNPANPEFTSLGGDGGRWWSAS